ncbi:MAG TPA: hypothetical protein DDX39_00600 [Bacteroidales bacterium]|nr:MAG: hypothetical protein A2W98_09705 [Bacteroidetes bacterium GWF2_33_38]OFY71615.1 MAG: hypothetical protein A2265_01120 [Bacteroidetes bacterium RIFOXYA12_FULL_33_9]OFY91215.1 MAG: hypothetical protein A2236_08625 [Bacteroidetes bacterium RIFOXYA2_FULL_33_7]HBF87110.1 hypothetical protein [Bacteroidales bacterium]
MIKLKAFQIADFIDIKKFKNEYTGNLHSFSSYELFYVNGDNSYLYILSYGVVVFSGYSELKMTENIEFMKSYSKKTLNNKLSEELIIHENASVDKFGHNDVHLSKFSADIIKIVMLNVGQSVTLDYYQEQTNQMLEDTNYYTSILEKEGRLSISSKKLLKFIGKTLNVKNSIIDQLYVIDQPDETWDDEYISKIDAGIRTLFDIKTRFRDIDYNLQIVKENLELFKDLMQHKRSNMLEIIIIVLILVEVVNLFLEKIF